MATASQRRFKRGMKKVQRDIKRNKPNTFYSYLTDSHIRSYYEDTSTPKLNKFIRFMKSVNITIITLALIICGIILSIPGVTDRYVAIPVTLMLLSFIQIVLGFISPRITFIVKSRLKAIFLYGFIVIVSFIVAGVMLMN